MQVRCATTGQTENKQRRTYRRTPNGLAKQYLFTHASQRIQAGRRSDRRHSSQVRESDAEAILSEQF